MLDGIFFYKLSNELNDLKTGKINKIQEISDDEFLFTVRRNSRNIKLLISLSPNSSRIHITEENYSFPREPKPFTMLLRKHFEGANIKLVESHETDRIIDIKTSKFNELGDFEEKTLHVEIMGRYSNLVLESNGVIIDALRHIGVSDMRTVMPNASYTYPDTQGKINPYKESKENLEKTLQKITNPSEMCQKILGLSKTNAIYCFDHNNYIDAFFSLLESNTPSLNKDPKYDVNYVSIGQSQTFPTYSALLEYYFKDVALKERIRQKTGNIEQVIKKLIKRNEEKIIKLNNELDSTKKAETYKLYGELLIANSYIKDKLDKIEVLNYYTNETITIPLDKKLYIKENANNYFKKYRKSKNTIIYASKELENANNEIEYLKLILSQIENSEVLEDVLEIQDELIREKYIIPQKKVSKLNKVQILSYIVNDSCVYVGKNNMQNERVTHELARKDDLWFHVKDAPGSHVVLKKTGDYTEEDIRTCAMLAAYYSTYKDSSSVPVNYTKVKNIKSIPGKRKCFVSIKDEKTIYIDPDKELISNLKKGKI